MDSNGRRRRNKRYSAPVQPPITRGASVFQGVCSFLVLVSLIVITYHLLEYHCRHCKYDVYTQEHGIGAMDELTGPVSKPWEYFRQIYDAQYCTQHQSLFKTRNSYEELEKKVMKISQDLSKIEEQISILDTLANAMGKGDFVWNDKSYWYGNKRNIGKEFNKTIVPYNRNINDKPETNLTVTSRNLCTGVF